MGSGTGRAVDLGAYIPSPEPYQGIACANGAPPQWPAVWLGHFQGGQASYDGVETELHWVDVKMCFPSQRLCGAYIRTLRRDFHRPIGYFTCLPLR